MGRNVVDPQFLYSRRPTRRVGLQPLRNLPAASEFDPRRPFPCPSARDCPTNGGLTNAAPPEPIDGRRAATQPTDNPACARAAHHTARRLAPSPRPRRDPPFCSSELPHEYLTSQCRPSQSTGDAPRRSPPTIRGARAPPAAHTACRHAPSPRPRCDPPFCSSELPHECLMSQCRPSQSTGHAPRHSPPTIRRARAAATHRHRAPDATPTSTRAALLFTPELPHGLTSQCRPSLSTGDAPRPSPHPAPAQHPCAGARPRRSARLSRVL
jgi:hypothetical protein